MKRENVALPFESFTPKASPSARLVRSGSFSQGNLTQSLRITSVKGWMGPVRGCSGCRDGRRFHTGILPSGAVLTEDLPDEHWLLQSSWDAGSAGTDSHHPHMDLVPRAEVWDRVAGGKKRLLVHSFPVRTCNRRSTALWMSHGQTDTP